jgi:hypothetical protein
MLNKDDKNALIELEKSYWWKVLKKLADSRIDEITRSTLCIEWFDSKDEATQAKLKEANMKILAIKEVLSLVKTNTLGVARPKV